MYSLFFLIHIGYALLVFAYDQLPAKYYKKLLVVIFAFVIAVVILLVLIQVLGYFFLSLSYLIVSLVGQVVH